MYLPQGSGLALIRKADVFRKLLTKLHYNLLICPCRSASPFTSDITRTLHRTSSSGSIWTPPLCGTCPRFRRLCNVLLPEFKTICNPPYIVHTRMYGVCLERLQSNLDITMEYVRLHASNMHMAIVAMHGACLQSISTSRIGCSVIVMVQLEQLDSQYRLSQTA